ncbi:Sugar kinase of the NBD/HSP70 family, may contain an N-terminal HTH domain [bacterium A37T11]|nr:Sugar kinase of the NBD/HSP70 family, may contain an N-terminal HTH domain [bacterium A37T11]
MFTDIQNHSALFKDIFRCLYYEKALSCADLSFRIQLSIPMIAKALRKMVKEGYVEEQGFAPSKGGRKPLLYSLKGDEYFILTVAMDQLTTRIGAVNLHNEKLIAAVNYKLALQDNPDSAEELIRAIENYLILTSVDKKKFIGVGIGMPGFVSVETGINYSYLPTKDVSITKLISDRLGLAVFLDNDSSIIALSELTFGKAKNEDNVMVVNLGWGIGLGMILNGSLFKGSEGYAGELSHIPITEDGKLCSCGKQGCLEAEASLLAITDQAIKGIRQGKATILQNLDINNLSKFEIGDALLDASLNGDQYAIELISEAGYKIGRALAILIHLMNPKTIVLSGRGAVVANLLMPPIQQALNKHCIKRISANTAIVISEIGYEAELLGGAVLVVESLLR